MARSIGRWIVVGMAIALLAGISPVAAAQSDSGSSGPGPGMMGDGPGMMGGGHGMMGRDHHGMMGGTWNTERYLDSLKTKLGITANEEPAWKEYADTVSGVAEQMRGVHQSMFDAMGAASWQQRRAMMNDMFEARQQAYATVHEAAGKLLSALDRRQQKNAKRILPGLAREHGMMHRQGAASAPP